MPNEYNSDAPSSDAKSQALSQSPVTPTAPEEGHIGAETKNASSDKENETVKELEKDIKAGEGWLIRISAAAVILNAVIALIYYGQLKEMRKATRASVKASDAAASAADTAKESVHLSERAYVTTFAPLVDLDKKLLSVAINNSGRLPSGPAQIIPHSFLIPIPIPSAPTVDLRTASEKHWSRDHFDAIQPGTPFTLTVPLRGMNTHLLESGHQQILIVGYVTYNDGFSGTPDQQWNFCFLSVYSLPMKQVVMHPCDFGSFLPVAIKADGYPNNESH
jgi:hypothetical protein